MSYLTDGTAGAALDTPTTEQKHSLGQVSHGNENTIWIYGVASGAVATGTCTVDATTFAITDTAGTYTADTALADGEYGWVRLTAGAT